MIKKRRPQTVKPQAQGKNAVDDSLSKTEDGKDKNKVLVTGDDVLIEYVSRIINFLKSIPEGEVPVLWMTQIDKFIQHYVWHTPDLKKSSF